MSEKIKPRKSRTYSLTVTAVPQRLCVYNSTRREIQVRVLGSDVVYITSAQQLPYIEGLPVSVYVPYRSQVNNGDLWILTSSGTVTAYCQDSTD